MTHRTTFALDEPTFRRLRRLSARWRVSQAEVVRRAVAAAEQELADGDVDPIVLLRELHNSEAGLSADRANAYLLEVREDRRNWRD